MSEAFRKLSLGFRLVYIGLILTVLSVVAGFVGGIVLAAAGAGGGPPPRPGGPFAAAPAGGVLAVMLVATGLSLAGGLLGLVGRIRCLAVPEAVPNARTMLGIAVGLELTATLINGLNNADQLGANFLPLWLKAGGGAVAGLFGVVSILLFLLFTAAVARYIDRPDLARSAMTVLKINVALIVCLVVLIGAAVATVFGAVAAGGGPGGGRAGAGANPAAGAAAVGGGLLACGMGLVVLVLALVGLILYARLLTGMTAACAAFADDPEGAGRYAEDYDAERDYDDE